MHGNNSPSKTVFRALTYALSNDVLIFVHRGCVRGGGNKAIQRALRGVINRRLMMFLCMSLVGKRSSFPFLKI